MLLSTAVCAIFGLGGTAWLWWGISPQACRRRGCPRCDLSDVRELILPALGVLLVAFSDDVLTGRAFERGSESIDANQELLALGVSNAGAGLLRGFPISSSGSRTAIGLAAGAHTQAYSLTALASILGVLLFARPVLASFPEAALGAIVVYAAVRLIDVQAFRRLAAFRPSEFVLALAACAGVLVFDILYGVLAAVGLSVAELCGGWPPARRHPGPGARDGRNARRGRLPTGGNDPGTGGLPLRRAALLRQRAGFPSPRSHRRRFRPRDGPLVHPQHRSQRRGRLHRVEAVEAVRAELGRRGTIFALARVKQDLLDDLVAFGLAEKIGDSGYSRPCRPRWPPTGNGPASTRYPGRTASPDQTTAMAGHAEPRGTRPKRLASAAIT